MIKLATLLEEIRQEKSLADKVKQLEANLESEFPQIQDLHLFLKSNGSLYIQSIRIKEEERRKGFGSIVMDRIKEFADENGLTISLAPEPESRYKEKLHSFYKKHGFVFNKGRHKDWQLSEPFSLSMYRRPKVKEAMDIPPAIYSPQSSIDKSFINYMKSVENETRTGFDKSKNLWFPYAEAENGNVVIAYGHKSESRQEAARLKLGITDQEAERLLHRDLEEAKEIINKYIQKQYGVRLTLDKNQTEMLSDFVFNMGRGAFSKFPKFVDSVLRKDWATAKKEYERNSSGNKLRRRNNYFFQRYLSKI